MYPEVDLFPLLRTASPTKSISDFCSAQTIAFASGAVANRTTTNFNSTPPNAGTST